MRVDFFFPIVVVSKLVYLTQDLCGLYQSGSFAKLVFLDSFEYFHDLLGLLTILT